MNKLWPILGALLIFVGCQSKKEPELSSIQIVDRSGINETISAKDRLHTYSKVSFESPQPYQKIVRVYEKDREGKTHAKMTTYHENGYISQYLEVVGGRAHGFYREWFPNGQLHMQAYVIEGIGDLTESAQSSWVFDHDSIVWNENGAKVAEIYYSKGMLDGVSKYFHSNGTLSKTVPYKKDQIHGMLEAYDEEGRVIGRTNYVEGLKHGVSNFYGHPQREEFYQKGYLIEGKYFDGKGELVGQIEKGFGTRKIFIGDTLQNEQEYKQGIPEGEARFYRKDGTLEGKYSIHFGKKNGEESSYNSDGERVLAIDWQDDEIHGNVRTWYNNGKLESEREMHHNKKQGMAIAWYRDGSLMLIEEYDNDLLVTGKYLKRGEGEPISRVMGGAGVATLYGPDGEFLRKVEYRRGRPVE